MKKLQGTAKKQQGEVMLEAAVIIVPVLLLLFALMSLSFFFYQESLMNTVATEVASDMARNLKYTDLDVGESVIDLDNIKNTSMFRMSFGKNRVAEAQAKRGEEYAKWRVPLSSLGLNPGELEVDCEVVYTGIGRAYVKATVSQRTDFFLSGVLDLLGVTEEQELFSSTAYAECLDPMAYTSMVNFTAYAGTVLDDFEPIGRLYENIKDLAAELME